MNMHYCDIFGDCCHCPAPYCPYEKYDDKTEYASDEEENLQDRSTENCKNWPIGQDKTL